MKTVLLVDDSRVTREVIKVYLIARDVRLVEACDGIEALQRVREDHPDLVLADIRMPRLDGFDLCRALQSDPATKGIPVLILTSNADPATVERCHEAGAREVLRKPIQPRPLLDAVRRHMGGERASA